MTRGDPHNLSSAIKSVKSKIIESPEISERDKKILIKGNSKFPSFLSYMQSKGHSDSRINRYLNTWRQISEHTEWDIEDVNKANLTDLVGDLNTGTFCKNNGEKYAASSIREFKKGLRKMYTDYIENYSSNLDVEDSFDGEELINFTLTIERKFTDSERLPNPEIVMKVVENMQRTRDKAYLLLLWSTGGRHAEILGLQWEDVSWSNSVGKVTFRDTKTGGDHTVPMGEAYPFMRKLFEEDPRSNENDAFVFRSRQTDEQLSASGAANIIYRNTPNSVPQKVKLNPHAFRKGRTSYWARQGKGEAWICKHMNWALGSEVVRFYCRLAQEDVEKGVKDHLNLVEKEDKNEKEESEILTPCECYECGEINTFQAEICRNCGEALQTSDLIREWQIEEKTNVFMEEIIKSDTEFDPKAINQKAKEFVREEFGI